MLLGTVSFKYSNVCLFEHLIRSVALKKKMKTTKTTAKKAQKTTKPRGQEKNKQKNRTKKP